MKKIFLLLPIVMLIAASCNSNSKKISQLEQQNENLQGQLSKAQQTDDFDLQAKCADSAAQFWKAQDYGTDTQPNEMDSYTDHWSSSLDKCMILINTSWTTDNTASTQLNEIELQDVLEGKTYADTLIKGTGVGWLNKTIITCWLWKNGDKNSSQRCSSEAEFDNFTNPFMNN